MSDDLKNITGDIADLTKTASKPQGISLFTDETKQTYKSTYQILKEISEIYDDLSDKTQAQLLEKLAGKRGGQVVAGLITNMKTAEKALVEMENAGGSADKEMEIIEQSVSYKLNALKQTWVGTAQSIVDRSDFGVAISGLTKLSEAIGFLVEQLGLLGTLAVGGGIFKGLKNIGNIKSWYKDLSSVQTVINEVATTTDIQTIANSISGLSKEQAMLALSTKVLSDEEKQEILVKAGIIASNNKVLLTKAQQVIANTELSASNKLAIKEDLELAASEGMVAKAEVERILSTKMVTDAEREKILSSLGLIEANNAQAASFGLVGKAALSSAKSMLLNPYTLIIAAIGGTIFALTKLADAEKEVGERAKKLSTEFKETKDEIEDYKTKINNLHDVINDNSSSYEEVTDARKNLLSIQDELIEKFGKEEGAISAVTEAIDSQSNALDKLTASQWQEKINKFNKSGFWNDFSNWVHDYDDNIDRMLDKMENTESRINLSDIFNNKEYNEILKDLEGRGYTLNQRGQYYSKDYDTLRDKYNELLEMQNKFKDTQSWLDEEIENDKKTLANNEDIYNQYVLNEKILKNDKLAESWQNVNKAYSEYQDAFTSGEDTTDAVQAYSKALNEAIKNSNGDKSIEEYFKNIYPTIYAEVQKWKFETEIIPTVNTDSLKDLTQNDIYKMLETKEVEEGEEVFKSILANAKEVGLVTGDYHEQVEQLLSLLVKWGVIQGDIKEEATSTLSTFEEAFNSSTFSDSKEKLLELAKSGELTSKTLTSTEDYKKLLTETGLTADYLVKRINNLVDATDRLNGVVKNVSSLDTLFKEMKENGFVDINNLESLGDTWQNLDGFEEFEKIVGDGKHSVEEMSTAFDNLVSEWLNVNNALNKVNESNAELYIKQLENVGISNARAIVEEQLASNFIAETNALEGLTEANKAEYIAKLKANNIANAEAIVTNKLTAEKEANDVITKQLGLSTDEFASKSYEAQFSLLDEANASANCRAEIADLRLEEISFNQSGLNVSGRISQLANLAVAYGLVNTAAQQMADRERAMKEYEAKTGAVTGFKYTQADYNHAAENLTKQIQAQFAKLSDTTVKYTGGKDSSSSSSSSSGSSSKDSSSESTPTKEVFDWIEVKIKRLQTAISEFGETASNVFKTLTERSKAYGSEISDVTTEIELQQQAYNKYLEKANSIGLSEDYASKVRSGNLSIDEIYDDTLKEQIKDYQTWYEKANDCLNTVNNLQEELAKLNIDNLQLSIDKVNAGLEKTQSKAEKINSKISDEYKRTKASDYNKLDSNYNKQISYYEKLNGYIKQQQSFVEKGSEKWLEFNKTIRENNSSIDELKKNIKENIILRIQLRLDNKKNVFDDIEKQYTKVQDSINLKDANSQYASSKDYNNLNKNIGKQIKNLQSQNKLYKELQKNIQKGSKAWEEYKDSIDDNNSSIRSLTESMVENSKAKAELNNTKASDKVGKVDSADELLKARINNVISYRKQNSYVNSEISNIDKRLAYYDKAVKDNKSGLNSAIKSINNTKSNSKTKSLLQKIKTYIKSKKSIPSNIISSVAKVNPSLANKCTDYNAYLTELEVSRETAKLYKETSKQEKADLAQEKMANIQKYYENRQGVLSQRATQLNSKIDLVQSSGYNVSSKFYDSLIANETKTNKSLANERNKLIKSLNNSIENGNIVKYSDEWYELCQKIDDVTNAQNESTKSLVEYQNALRQLKWDNFDYLETQISNISSEVDFMINQLSRNDLASNDIGGITDEGKAVNVLHASNYTTYTKQANDYKNQITKINKELADDPYNKTLIERKEELIKSYQDCINKAQEEKYAVIDLYTQGYEALKSKISDLISEYEKLLDAEKDAYDYQNNINDKTKQIAQIRKQLEAYANDNSEETKSTVQKLKVSLEDAEKDLKDTQYDKYISSTKDILSDLQDNLSDDIDEIIKNMADNFNQLITAINDNSKNASKIIKDEMKGIGYTSTDEFKSMISTSDIVKSTKQAINDTKEFQQKMLEYADKQYSGTETNTAIDKLIQTEGKNSLNNDLEKANSATSAAEKAMQSKLKELENLQNEVNVAEITYKNTKEKYGSKSDKTINAENKYNELQKNYSKLHAEYSASVEDYNNAKLFSDTMKFLGEHLSVSKEARNNLSDLNKVLYDNYGQRILSDSEVDKLAELLNTKSVQTKSGSLYKKLKKMGINGFRVGSSNIPYDQIALVNEAGQELQYDSSQGTIRALGKGDMIFTHEMAQKLWDFASQNPIPLNSSFMSPNRPEFNNTTTNVGDVNINMGGITMNGVNDPEEFTKELNKNLATNPNTIKIMKTNTIGSLSKNYNSLGARSKI